MEHGRNTVPADSWDNCVEFRRRVPRDAIQRPLLDALVAAKDVVDKVADERERLGPPQSRGAGTKSHFVPKQRKFKIAKQKSPS